MSRNDIVNEIVLQPFYEENFDLSQSNSPYLLELNSQGIVDVEESSNHKENMKQHVRDQEYSRCTSNFQVADLPSFGSQEFVTSFDNSSFSQILGTQNGQNFFVEAEEGMTTPLMDNFAPTTNVKLAVLPASETVCLDHYPGDFGFEVLPAKAQDGPKLRYHYASRKLFCKKGTHEFHVRMDFSKISYPQNLSVRACCVFTEPEYSNKVVRKCLTCIDMDSKESIGFREDQCSYSFLRAPKEDHNVSYAKSEETGRYYVTIPVKCPEPGTDVLKQNFKFSCMSSCKLPGVNRRASAIVFTLLDETNQVRGRTIIGLRVCSAPPRDYDAEFGEKATQLDRVRTGRVQKFPGRKGKAKGTTARRALVKLEPIGPTVPEKLAENQMVVEPFLPGEFVLDSTTGSQEQSSSQETVFDGEEFQDFSTKQLRLRKLMKDSREVLRMNHSTVSNQRVIAKNLFTTLQTAQNLCLLAKQTSE